MFLPKQTICNTYPKRINFLNQKKIWNRLKKDIFFHKNNFIFTHEYYTCLQKLKYICSQLKNSFIPDFQPKGKIYYTYPKIFNFPKKFFPNPLKKLIFNRTKKFLSFPVINQFFTWKPWENYFKSKEKFLILTYQ